MQKCQPDYYSCVVRISSCHWIFGHKWFSEADTSKEHIEHIIFFLYPLANPLTTDLFWCRLYQLGQLAEKQCPWVDRLEGEEIFFCGQCVPNGCLLWKMTYGKISDHMKKFFMTSNISKKKEPSFNFSPSQLFHNKS